MHRRWLISKTNPEFISYLSSAASITPVLAQILVNRGVKTASAVKDFLSPGLSGLSDPFELPDMKKAVERIRAAAARNEKVLVHGDYDADGVSAASIMTSALSASGVAAECFIPHRMRHGYGFNPAGVEAAKAFGASLIVTVDCGITSFEAVSAAAASNIDVIVTDHHEPARKPQSHAEFILPEALAVINPKLMPEGSAQAVLSGAGVAFKLAHAMAETTPPLLSREEVYALLDLAAVGTSADVVPLLGENRIILKHGLDLIRSSERPGFRALKDVSGLGSREIRAHTLAFSLAPRINAAGRMAEAQEAVRLLLAKEMSEAVEFSERLDALNRERQKVEEAVYRDALSGIDRPALGSVIVSAGENRHQGVLGIAASRLAEEFSRPAFVFSIEEGVAKGSARSIPAFDIHKGLTLLSDLLIAFGGHTQAAGVKLKAENLPAFEAAMDKIVSESLSKSDFTPTIEMDANVSLFDITPGLISELSLLEPCGCCNPEPLLGSRALDVVNPRVVGNNHLKMRLKKNSHSLDTIGFDMAKDYETMNSPSVVDAVFTPSVNDWNGGRYLQLLLKALRPSA